MPPSKLSVYRRKKGFTQEQLSELSGVTTRTIQRIEKGSVVPHIQTLKLLADCLDIETDVLMDAPEGVDSTTQSPGSNADKSSLTPLFHLSALIGLFFPILNILLPFVLWILKRNEEEYDNQGKKVLNFQITMMLLFFPSIALMVFYFPIGFPIMLTIYIYDFVMTAINLFRSSKSMSVRYPLSIRFFKFRLAKAS